MNATELFEYMKESAGKVNELAMVARQIRWGYAIPIPDGSTEETRQQVDEKLTRLCWNFQRCRIGHIEHYVLFP